MASVMVAVIFLHKMVDKMDKVVVKELLYMQKTKIELSYTLIMTIM